MTNDELRKHMMTALGELAHASSELHRAMDMINNDVSCRGHIVNSHDHTLMALTNLHNLRKSFPSVTSGFIPPYRGAGIGRARDDLSLDGESNR